MLTVSQIGTNQRSITAEQLLWNNYMMEQYTWKKINEVQLQYQLIFKMKSGKEKRLKNLKLYFLAQKQAKLTYTVYTVDSHYLW